MTTSDRRDFLKGAALGIAGGGVLLSGPELALAAPPPRDPRTDTTGRPGRIEALAVPLAGEEVVFIPAIAMVPNGTAATSAIIVNSAGIRSEVLTEYVSAGITLPVGAVLTSVDMVVEGHPQSGFIGVIRYAPEAGTSTGLAFQAINANGISTVHMALNELYTGTTTYEAWFQGGGTTVGCNGVRYTYRKPDAGFVPMTPTRVYDSRFSMAPDVNGPIAGSTRTVSVASARSTGDGTVVGTALPTAAGATAIAYTLTIANTVGSGFVAVNPGGVGAVSASTINWSATGQSLANTGVVQLGGDRQVTLIGSGGGGSCDVIIDLVGYYR